MTRQELKEMVQHYGKDQTLELLRQQINDLEKQRVMR